VHDISLCQVTGRLVVASSDVKGCDKSLLQEERVAGNIVLVERGDCMFIEKGRVLQVSYLLLKVVGHSVGDPEPDPQDPHVFGPLGSGSSSQIYGSGSGSCSGSFPFLINVLSGLKDFLQNKILTQNFSKKFDF
jgi:hypothetical protein